jgi:hypothetical protein
MSSHDPMSLRTAPFATPTDLKSTAITPAAEAIILAMKSPSSFDGVIGPSRHVTLKRLSVAF